MISALFGLFQGGIVPMYAVIVREYFPPQEAGTRLGIVLMATLFGMALGGWMSGVIFDLTGSSSGLPGLRMDRGGSLQGNSSAGPHLRADRRDLRLLFFVLQARHLHPTSLMKASK